MPFGGLVGFGDAGNGAEFFMSLSGDNEVSVWDHENDSRTWVASTVLGYLEAWMRGRDHLIEPPPTTAQRHE